MGAGATLALTTWESGPPGLPIMMSASSMGLRLLTVWRPGEITTSSTWATVKEIERRCLRATRASQKTPGLKCQSKSGNAQASK